MVWVFSSFGVFVSFIFSGVLVLVSDVSILVLSVVDILDIGLSISLVLGWVMICLFLVMINVRFDGVGCMVVIMLCIWFSGMVLFIVLVVLLLCISGVENEMYFMFVDILL